MLALLLPAEIEQRLDALAKAIGRTKGFYARETILTHLDGLADIFLASASRYSLSFDVALRNKKPVSAGFL